MNHVTATAHPLLVPPGATLGQGKLYLRLYHGRNDPGQEMEGWGFDGPLFGPLSSYVHTYCSTFRMIGESNDEELWLSRRDDMIVWEGCYYGDLEVFVATGGQVAPPEAAQQHQRKGE